MKRRGCSRQQERRNEACEEICGSGATVQCDNVGPKVVRVDGGVIIHNDKGTTGERSCTKDEKQATSGANW
jgi:hypothetical protein